MSAVDSGSSPKTESRELNADFEWNPETEVHLFYAMKGHKPVGVNRYFQMICIQEMFNGLVNKEVPSQVIWEHLDKMYDMEALHENEDLPFPNDNVEFCLPAEFEDLKSRKINPKSEENSNGSKSNDSTATSQSVESTSNSSAVATSNEGATSKEDTKTESKASEVSTEKPKDSAKNEDKETKTPKKRGKPPKSGQNGNISNTSTNSSSKKRKV